MKRILLAIALPLALVGMSGCATIPNSPADLTAQTGLDERIATGFNLAYTAAAKGAALAIRSGLVKDKPTIIEIGILSAKAYAAVLAVQHAYEASNATDYQTAIMRARAAIAELTAIF